RTSRSTRRISARWRGRPAPREVESASLSLPRRRKAFRAAGLLASGSLAVGLLPGRATFSISRVQWFLARGVPGDSGGGRAGFTPASLDRTESKNERRRYCREAEVSTGPADTIRRDAHPGFHARFRPAAPRRVPRSRSGAGE